MYMVEHCSSKARFVNENIEMRFNKIFIDSFAMVHKSFTIFIPLFFTGSFYSSPLTKRNKKYFHCPNEITTR